MCGEEILSIAKKCKHCGEYLDVSIRGDLLPTSSMGTHEMIGLIMLIIPVVGTVLLWSWVSNLRLIDDPMGKISLITALTVVATATFAAFDAAQLGFGSPDAKTRQERSSPFTWFLRIVILWVVGYPLYLYMRSRLGARNLCWAGSGVALVYLISSITLVSVYYEQMELSEAHLFPPVITEQEVQDAIDRMPPEQKIRAIAGSPVPQAEKEQRYAEIEKETGVRASDVLGGKLSGFSEGG